MELQYNGKIGKFVSIVVAVVAVLPKVLAVEKAQRMAEVFALLADPNRLRILSALAQQELCVCDLAAAVTMNESAVSHQLRLLRSLRLVSFRKEKRRVFYRLQDQHVMELYQSVSEHLDEPTETGESLPESCLHS